MRVCNEFQRSKCRSLWNAAVDNGGVETAINHNKCRTAICKIQLELTQGLASERTPFVQNLNEAIVVHSINNRILRSKGIGGVNCTSSVARWPTKRSRPFFGLLLY